MSEITPLHALKALIIQDLLAGLRKEPHDFTAATGDDIDELWEAMKDEHPDSLQDTMSDIRTSGHDTGLDAESSRHYESTAVAALTPFNKWVGWTYWSGGGKFGAPSEIDWMEDAYWVQAEVDQVLRLSYKFSKPEGEPEPFEVSTMEDFRRRMDCMNFFCAPVSTESMVGQNVYGWIHTESQKIVAEMVEGAEAGVGPMTAFQNAFGTGPISGVVAELFAQEMMATPAKNFFELVYHTPELGEFSVTIQRHEGLTPGQKLDAAEVERDKLLAQLKDTVSAYEVGADVFGGIERARQLIAQLEAK